MPDRVELKKGSTGTLTPEETPLNQTSHEISSIPTSSVEPKSNRVRGMKV